MDQFTLRNNFCSFSIPIFVQFFSPWISHLRLLTVARSCFHVFCWKVAEKILEHKKFGQDLLTTEDTADPHPMNFPVGSCSASSRTAPTKPPGKGCCCWSSSPGVGHRLVVDKWIWIHGIHSWCPLHFLIYYDMQNILLMATILI